MEIKKLFYSRRLQVFRLASAGEAELLTKQNGWYYIAELDEATFRRFDYYAFLAAHAVGRALTVREMRQTWQQYERDRLSNAESFGKKYTKSCP